jgi:hypothetical protein
MSVTKRILWIVPAVLVASWLAVRSMAALPAPERDVDLGDPPPLTSTGQGIHDAALARLIARFAAEARAGT